MPTDLTRRSKPCPTCGGKGFVGSIGPHTNFARLDNFEDEDTEKCPTCHGVRTIPAETYKEYAARLVALVEQEHNKKEWLIERLITLHTCVVPILCNNQTPDECRTCIKDYINKELYKKDGA